MKFRYDQPGDALMIWLSKQPIDHAEQNRNVIVHFSKRNKPVLIEILRASDFLQQSSQVLPAALKQKVLAA